jgi:hypothetical protein
MNDLVSSNSSSRNHMKATPICLKPSMYRSPGERGVAMQSMLRGRSRGLFPIHSRRLGTSPCLDQQQKCLPFEVFGSAIHSSSFRPRQNNVACSALCKSTAVVFESYRGM